ncbi:Retrotransposon gag protein [Corchorus capsularis]|uniref:Retrotransposon gag protein n=1 Tax=Corchorus capsularis TaxID=210143 RepID=A0A1R3HCP6_COCAP|nr:Retrotransposon gag protein [Corchorus capsularis]
MPYPRMPLPPMSYQPMAFPSIPFQQVNPYHVRTSSLSILSIDRSSFSRQLGCTTFNSDISPVEAQKWLTHVSDDFTKMGLDDAAKVEFVKGFLSGTAWTWWQSVRKEVGGEITWSRFVAEFCAEYYTVYNKSSATKEFFELTQGSMSLEEYEIKLRRLARCIRLSHDKDILCSRFAFGLREQLKPALAIKLKYNRFVAAAKQAEVEAGRAPNKKKSSWFHKIFKGKNKRQQHESSSNQSSKRSRSSGSSSGASLSSYGGSPQVHASPLGISAQGSSYGNRAQMRSNICKNCRSEHDGLCPFPSLCYHYGGTDHLKRDCPIRQLINDISKWSNQYTSFDRTTAVANVFATSSGTLAPESHTRGRAQPRMHTRTRQNRQFNPDNSSGNH